LQQTKFASSVVFLMLRQRLYCSIQLLVRSPNSISSAMPTPQLGSRRSGSVSRGCGGIHGYAQMLKVIADVTHSEHEELLQWLGGAYDA
jgi:hypothetical protein